MSVPAPLLEVVDVRLVLGAVRALDGINLQVDVGEHVGLVGPNGAGKSTLLDVLIGRRTPNSGAVMLDGEDLTRLVPRQRARRGIGIVLQGGRVIEHLTVGDHLRLATLTRRSQRLEAEEAPVDDLIAASMGTAGLAHHLRADELSRPQRQWLDLLMVLGTAPRLLLIDEPTSGMDQEGRESTADMLRSVREQRPTLASIVVEHDSDFIATVTDRVVRIQDGRVITQAPEVEDAP